MVSLSLFFLFAALGCGTHSWVGERSRGFSKKEPVEVAGTLSLRGSSPFPLLLLEAQGGDVYAVQSSSILSELKSLSGMEVSITGFLVEEEGGSPPVLVALTYRLLPLPGGEVPLVGKVRLAEGGCFLETEAGGSWQITGEFAVIFRELPGAKVWVIGETSDAGEEHGTIRVVGYGLIKRTE